MNITSYKKTLILFACTFLLLSCAEKGILGSGATPGSGGTTDLGANLELKSHFTNNITVEGLYLGDSISTIIVNDASNIYRADSAGETSLSTTGLLDVIALSTDSTTLVHAKNGGGIDIINPVTQTVQPIGSSFTFSTTLDGAQITADGSLVAFVTSSDLASNPGSFLQIYTLSTDGNDTISQVTNFASSSELSQTNLALSGDGATLFFHSTADVLNDGSNANGADEVFSINTDGTNLKQVTSGSVAAVSRILEMETDASGTKVAFIRADYSQIPTVYNLYSTDTSTNTSVFISAIKMTGWGTNDIYFDIFDQFDISSNGSTIYYVTDDGGLSRIYSVHSDGSNNVMEFNTGNTMVKGLHASATGTAVTFITDGEYGLTMIGVESQTQVYTLTP